MSDELRHRLENAGRDPVTPLKLDVVEKRARRLTLQTLAVAMFSVAAVLAGAFAVRSAISTDAAPAPPAEKTEQETTQASGGMWPQSSLEEAQKAQRLADEGDPRYTWQVFRDWPP